jgi:hypothetical protein
MRLIHPDFPEDQRDLVSTIGVCQAVWIDFVDMQGVAVLVACTPYTFFYSSFQISVCQSIPPLPEGALHNKSVLRLFYYRFNAQNLADSLSILTYCAKPPEGEGEYATAHGTRCTRGSYLIVHLAVDHSTVKGCTTLRLAGSCGSYACCSVSCMSVSALLFFSLGSHAPRRYTAYQSAP